MSNPQKIWNSDYPTVNLETSQEKGAWAIVAEGWRPVYGNIQHKGLSVEWHDFTPPVDLEWHRSFHPDTVEICLNLEGSGRLMLGGERWEVDKKTAAVYLPQPGLRAIRPMDQRHRFLTLEASRDWLRLFFTGNEHNLCPGLREFLRGEELTCPGVQVWPITMDLQNIAEQTLQPPVAPAGKELWYQAKFLELASGFFFLDNRSERQPFCLQQKAIGNERVEQTKQLLLENLAEPLTLQELGKNVGCSPYYLSRIFSQHTGMTIPQFLKNARMKKAAELLRTGKYNVTETAYEVGYNSLSHFSKVFYESYGCCPGLYPNVGLFQSQRDPD